MSYRTEHSPASIRQAILDTLTRAGSDHMKTNEISKAIGVKATDPAYEMVRDALDALVEEGVIFRTTRRRYGRAVPNVTVEGRLENTRGGWLVIPAGDRDGGLQIESRDTWTGMHGDIVRAKMTAPPIPGERPRGEVTRVITRANPTIVGTVKLGRGYFLEPDDRKIHRTITITRKGLGDAKVGDKVVVTLLEWNDPFDEPHGTVTKVLGRTGEMNAEIAAIAAAYRLPHVFDADVLAEAEAFADELTDDDLRGRRDLRALTTFTIDPVDARDFDDAVSIEEHADGDVTLGVHIADVSHYVREGTALDREAARRGTSVYLVTGVIPMLPERLSNNLCSLRPHEDRLAYSVLVRLSPRGAVKDYEIVKSVINSKRRFTYEEALAVLETGEGDFAAELAAINKAAHVQRANRRRKGSVDFDRAETKFRLDENNHPVEVIQKRATESTRLVEDCMLLANRVVAEHIGARAARKSAKGEGHGGERNPFLYRIHDVPPLEKLLQLSEFVKSLGYSLPVENIRPKDIQRLVDSARGTDEEDLVNEMTLRSMAKAVYSEFNIGHFGLAFIHYTHFTSPIRRYPDLIVHRMLDEYAHGMSGDRKAMYARELGGIADHCSERERSAVEAERESIKIAQVEFLKDHVGEAFEATVAGVMPFGMFAELKRFGIEGLVRMRGHDDDYFVYDERSRSFKGLRTKRQYRLGDAIHVRVTRVNDQRSEIDMELIDEEEFQASVEAGAVMRERAAGGGGFPMAEILRGPASGARGRGARSSGGGRGGGGRAAGGRGVRVGDGGSRGGSATKRSKGGAQAEAGQETGKRGSRKQGAATPAASKSGTPKARASKPVAPKSGAPKSGAPKSGVQKPRSAKPGAKKHGGAKGGGKKRGGGRQ